MRKAKREHVDPGRETADDIAFALDDFFPHIINRITSRIRTDFESKARRHGIAVEQWRVLVCLFTRGPQRITTLAELTSIELPTMSYLLKRMARDKLIARQSARVDGRITLVSLTKHGRAMTSRLLPMVRQYEEIAFQGMKPSQIRKLKNQLKTILNVFDRLHQQRQHSRKEAARAGADFRT
ncbi:MAG: MarR family winged helix-turn-helix transcriptional regulator [Xanthobacteraceae bacterium]